jgi:hypothetical protein
MLSNITLGGDQMVLYDKPYVEISWNETTRIVTATYKSYMTSEQLREVFLKILEFMAQYKSTKYLSDTRKFVTVKPEDQKWINEVFMKKAQLAGVKKVAIILPENMIQKQVVEKSVAQSSSTVEMKLFGSINEGMLWLR